MKILTFDIEEWWVYKKYPYYGHANVYLPRIDRYLHEILDALEERNFRATFFCVGDVARHYPEVVRRIAARGHHMGCHSYGHRLIGELTPKEFAEDTGLAMAVLEDVIGEKVDAYRAPGFSIGEATSWALETLAENGIEYDSSIFPSSHRGGGYASFGVERPLIVRYGEAGVREFPVSLMSVLGRRVGFSGGGYFRLMPYPLIRRATEGSDYVMSYFHIRDFDAELARSVSIMDVNSSYTNYFKSFYGISGAYGKFQRYIRDYRFVSIREAAKEIDWESVDVANV